MGAGGAGKTTCCAALLGAYRKSSSLPASCATITREAERGELRMILSPYIMKPSPARAPRALRALRRARGDGMAVLDTPSLSPSDRAGVRELARLLAELEPERVVVALPATLGATAAAQLLQALRPLGANALAVTHADETDQIGVAVEAACRFGLAPEYMLERGRAGGWRLRQIGPTASGGEAVAMKFGRGNAEKSQPVTLPERSQTVTLIPPGGEDPARVLERGPDTLLVAIMVPTAPLSQRQLEG